jgi:hypothetical protein
MSAGMHHDPLRSTQRRPFFAFGHNFVVFSLQVALPFAPNKYWALPILVRMCRKRHTNQRAPGKGGKLERKQTGRAPAKQYHTRPELALEMIQMVASWIPQRTLRVLRDSEYADQSISRHLPANAKLISRMHMKAALYALPEKAAKRGRRRKKGGYVPSSYNTRRGHSDGRAVGAHQETQERCAFGSVVCALERAAPPIHGR